MSKFSIKEWQDKYLIESDLYQVTWKKGHNKHSIPVSYGNAIPSKIYSKMSKSDAEEIAKQDKDYIVQKMTWLKKKKPSGTAHPKDISKMKDFDKFMLELDDSGWEFENFPKKFGSLLDKKAEDGEIAYDQLTGVTNYQDFENWVAHYVTNGQEDWYLLVSATGKVEAVKGAPKFKTI